MGSSGFDGSLQPMGVSVQGSMGEPEGGWATIQRVLGAHIFVQPGMKAGPEGAWVVSCG